MEAPKNPLFPSKKNNPTHTARSKQYSAAATPLTQPAGHRRFPSLRSALPPEALPGHGPPIAGERGWGSASPWLPPRPPSWLLLGAVLLRPFPAMAAGGQRPF